jgi:NADH-quinone oxidoreductase subunit J
MEQVLFYILAAVLVTATFLSITEKHAVHAIVYLATSFFALAVIFYLLSAPLVAVFEVIIYAGAIMVLFLFVIMMLDLGEPGRMRRPGAAEWLPALVLGLVTLSAFVALVSRHKVSVLHVAPQIGIRDFATLLFSRYGLAVEVVSLQLLFALVGGFYLGRRK